MGFSYEHECPQCGAPFELDETHHFLKCQYCHANSYLDGGDYFRFVLPHRAIDDEELIYVPYLRFRGTMFSCHGLTISYRLVDLTKIGLRLDRLPDTLGVRPQALKMKFASTVTNARFLRYSFDLKALLAGAGRIPGEKEPSDLHHRDFIGETTSIIYLPLAVHDTNVFDAVTMDKILSLPENFDLFGPAVEQAVPWKPEFLATICPDCGWNLDGEVDSIVLLCANCHTAWQPSGKNFIKLDCLAMPSKNPETISLPFWKITATTTGIAIDTIADFVRRTNLPLAIRKEWESQEMSYWCPAFKINPKNFLQLAGQLTGSVKPLDLAPLTHLGELHPVTLPQSDGLQSLKFILASSAVSKKEVFSSLPEIDFQVKKMELAYLPFTNSGYGLYQEELKININKQTLKYGRNL